MRILLLHNHYRNEGGEERAVREIVSLLQRKGDVVELLERSSEQIGRAQAAAGLLRGGIDPQAIARRVRRMRADAVHVHNIHPLFGWRALAAARDAGAKTVLHLHNFRLYCAIGISYRDGTPCFRCRGANTMPGLRLRCRGSVPEAAVYAAALHRQQPRLLEHSDEIIVVSQATAGRLIELGLPAHKTTVMPNFVPAAALAGSSCADQGEYALVAGRLVEEKGFDTAILAARAAGVPLLIAGDGPDAPRLRALASGADVRFAGHLSSPALAAARAGAAVLLAPSRWEEPCPYSVLDALADGVPVLASDRGGLPDLVGAEHALAADDTNRWTASLAQLWADPVLRRTSGENALRRARELFDEDSYYERLTQLYGCVPRPGSNQIE